MAGMLTPFRTERMVCELKQAIGLPIQVHCHYIGGMAPMNYLKAVEAGAATVDTAVVALAFGNSQPAGEMIVAALKESPFDTGIDLTLLFDIAHYWEEVRERNHVKRGTTSLLSMEVFSHQVPGGMMSNLLSQLEVQHALDRLPDVLDEIAVVRAEVGYPPLVTPMSQIVGTQAVLNVLTGKRYSIVPTEMRDYLLGKYGKSPGKMKPAIVQAVLGPDAEALRAAARATGSATAQPGYDELAAEIGDLARNEEDVLMYALFPNEARAYLEKHASGVENAVFMTADEARVVREEEGNEMNLDQIKELVATLEASEVAEICIEEGDSKVTLRKAGAGVSTSIPAPSVASNTSAVAVPGGVAAGVATDGHEEGWKAVTSPMVGTFYAAPSPDDPPFVSVGDEVKAGQTVGIVEAMKLMNEVVIEEDGIIRESSVQNAAAVEFATPLVWYEPV
jgi:oxaloacetate decarboxylase alpha subunit